MQNFEQIRSHVQGKYKLTSQEPYLLCVELSMDKGTRHQSIFLAQLDGEDDREYLRVSTAIAPITGLDLRKMLTFNWQSRVGYMAIGDMDGVPYLMLCENRPFGAVPASEVDRLILEIGGLGDQLERALSAGGDLL